MRYAHWRIVISCAGPLQLVTGTLQSYISISAIGGMLVTSERPVRHTHESYEVDQQHVHRHTSDDGGKRTSTCVINYCN